MNEQADIRRIWRREWLGCLAGFANGDVQQRKWLDQKNTNPHWSYAEFMCNYFDDTLHGDTYDWPLAQGYVMADEVSAVAALHELLVRHEAPGGDDHDNAAVLADPAWHEIVEAAVQVRKHLLAVLTDTDEIDILLDAG